MNAEELWDWIEKIRAESGRHATRDLVAEAIRESQELAIEPVVSLLCGDVLPPEKNLGVGKKTVRKSIEESYGVDYSYIREVEKRRGDLTTVPMELDQPNRLIVTQRDYTVFELLDIVKEIADTSSENQKIATITRYLNESVNPQMVVYALLCEKKDYAIGVSWKTVRDALSEHFNISTETFERVYGLGYEVGKTASLLLTDRPNPEKLIPGRRVRPMLASSKDLPDDTEDWVADVKYDGGRLLIHQDENGDIQAFTRKRREISDNLPELHEVEWPDCPFVVDAEAVGYDPETGEPLPFQKFMERFQREKDIEEKAEEVEIDFRLFDVLYYAGDITNLAYWERRTVLDAEFPDDLVADQWNDLDAAFDYALDQGHEGIIAKHEEHQYVFQRSDQWLKLKPTKEPIEVRVTDALPGTGRLAGTLGALRVESADGVDLGRVGTGFKDKDREHLWSMGKDELVGSIVEIEFEELQENDGDYGLRFPRYLRLRPEGEPDTLERIKEL